jgi:hypothetical protein
LKEDSLIQKNFIRSDIICCNVALANTWFAHMQMMNLDRYEKNYDSVNYAFVIGGHLVVNVRFIKCCTFKRHACLSHLQTILVRKRKIYKEQHKHQSTARSSMLHKNSRT